MSKKSVKKPKLREKFNDNVCKLYKTRNRTQPTGTILCSKCKQYKASVNFPTRVRRVFREQGYLKHSEWCNQCLAAKAQEYRRKLRDKCFAHYGQLLNAGYICYVCEEHAKAALHLYRVKRSAKDRLTVYPDIASTGYLSQLVREDFPDALIPLCDNCIAKYRNTNIAKKEDIK